MDGLAGVLIIVAIGVLAAGPVAFILALVLFNKIGKLEEKVRYLAMGRNLEVSLPPVTKPAPVATPYVPDMPHPVIVTPPVELKAPPAELESRWPVKPVEPPVEKPQVSAPAAPKPEPIRPPVSAQAAAPRPPVFKPAVQKALWAGLEQKIGTIAALFAGVITVIVGVAFFLKYVIDNAWFGPKEKVCLVAVGGIAAMIIGEITRRRGFEIVAKGTTAMGFALLYAAVFSASRIYMLIETQSAFILAMAITAGAMAYAVALNEVVIAFLSLLGGYLSPIIISTGQNLAIPLFSYLLALGIGALGCAMFRRWRAVNWIALVGTYLLYTGWFEKFYTPAQMTLAMSWLGVFGGLFLIQPILYGLVRKVAARAEDVGLLVANSAAVFYYLWRMLYAEHQQAQAIAAAVVGVIHLALMAAVLIRCREDRKLQSALGVLGTAYLTTAIPLYCSTMNPTLLSWSVEAVALTFIGIRYRSLWTKAMAFIVTAIAALGLFYHLPLHGSETFRIVFNAPFGTWVFVSATVLVCHALWRFMAESQDEEGRFAAQAYYAAGVLLLGVGCAMEWLFYSRGDHGPGLGQPMFLQGMMVIAAVLTAVLLARPLCPRGGLVRTAGMLAALFGSIYTALAMMGVYHSAFRIFVNGPFVIACGFAAAVFLCAWWTHRTNVKTSMSEQRTAAMVVMGLGLVFVLLAEQGYSYWYCRNEYVQPVAHWQASAVQTMALCWAVYGMVMLAAALRFDRLWLKAAAILAAAASAAILAAAFPLHPNGDFRFMFNLPFTAWIVVAAAFVAGHGLWRTVKIADENQSRLMMQVYYAAGVALAALGWTMEWYAHCRWHVAGKAGDANFLLGTILLLSGVVMVYLMRPLPPKGVMVRTLGVLVAVCSMAFVVYAMPDVHIKAFTVFFNLPFAIAALFVVAVMAGVWGVRQAGRDDKQWASVRAFMVLAGLVLVWVVLSQEVYYYWACRDAFAGPVDNWRFSAQMYMSVAWAIYGAALVVGGFAFRARGVRYLSLILFAVLLAKIFLKDTVTLRIEYRIAAFLTTGLILVGVSFVYQYLKKKGFFEEIPNTQAEAKE